MSHFRGQIEYRDQLVDLHVLQLANQHVCTQCLKKYHKRFFNMYEEYCIERKISISREKLKCNTCMGRPRKCRTCDEKKKIYDYDSDEMRKDKEWKCKECKAKPRKPRAKPKQPRKKKCVSCKKAKSQDELNLDEWENERSRRRRCLTCVASHTLTVGVKTRKRKERE